MLFLWLQLNDLNHVECFRTSVYSNTDYSEKGNCWPRLGMEWWKEILWQSPQSHWHVFSWVTSDCGCRGGHTITQAKVSEVVCKLRSGKAAGIHPPSTLCILDYRILWLCLGWHTSRTLHDGWAQYLLTGVNAPNFNKWEHRAYYGIPREHTEL